MKRTEDEKAPKERKPTRITRTRERTARKAGEATSYSERAERREEKGEPHVTIHSPVNRKTDMQENSGEPKRELPKKGRIVRN